MLRRREQGCPEVQPLYPRAKPPRKDEQLLDGGVGCPDLSQRRARTLRSKNINLLRDMAPFQMKLPRAPRGIRNFAQ